MLKNQIKILIKHIFKIQGYIINIISLCYLMKIV